MSQMQAAPQEPTSAELSARWLDVLGTLPPGYDTIPDAVLARASQDDRFARYLVECRQNPHLLSMLFADPANKDYAPRSSRRPRTNLQAATQAAASLAKWAGTAFRSVDLAEADRRLSVCRACPHIANIDAAPTVTRIASSETAICGLCGCPLGRKARMATESCPDADPRQPGLNRWGQPRKA